MGKPVNLNQYRKQKARDKDKSQADENAIRFGQPKLETDLARAKSEKANRDLDSHKNDP